LYRKPNTNHTTTVFKLLCCGFLTDSGHAYATGMRLPSVVVCTECIVARAKVTTDSL